MTPATAAARLEYLHRLTPRWSAFGEAWAGVARANGHWGHDVGAQAGVRFRW